VTIAKKVTNTDTEDDAKSSISSSSLLSTSSSQHYQVMESAAVQVNTTLKFTNGDGKSENEHST
jgi:hypothetical protein